MLLRRLLLGGPILSSLSEDTINSDSVRGERFLEDNYNENTPEIYAKIRSNASNDDANGMIDANEVTEVNEIYDIREVEEVQVVNQVIQVSHLDEVASLARRAWSRDVPTYLGPLLEIAG